MDRKAWIVVSLCTLGMLYYLLVYSPDLVRQQREYRQKQLVAEEAKKAAEAPAKGAGEGTETIDPVAPDASGETPATDPATPGTPATPEVAAETVELKTSDADGEPATVITLTNQGGGVEEVNFHIISCLL